MHSCICLTFALLCINVSSKSIQEDAKLHFFYFSPQCFLKYTSRLPEKLDAKSHHRWGKVTLIAFVWFFSTIVQVYFQMPPQIACLWGFKVIWLHLFDLVTLSVVSFRFFTFASFKPKSTKVFHMTPNNACMGRCIVAFVWLLLCCALMCPRSPYKRMQSCIFFTFPRNVFWNIPPDCLRNWMQNHITDEVKSHWLHFFGISPLYVFICLLKLRACEDAKSNGYICLTFLHCMYSNVSSNGLPQRIHIA